MIKAGLKNRNIYSYTMNLNLNYCIVDYEIGNRWPQFAEIAKDNKYNHVMPYADFNVALASLRGGDWESAQGMLEGLKKVVKYVFNLILLLYWIILDILL